jgi:hypothetical protein
MYSTCPFCKCSFIKQHSQFLVFSFGGLECVGWNWVETKCGIELVMSHKMLICKAGIDFSSLKTSPSIPAHFEEEESIIAPFLIPTPPPCRESIPQRNWFLTRNLFPWIDSLGL